MTVSDADTAKMEGPQATDKILTKERGDNALTTVNIG